MLLILLACATPAPSGTCTEASALEPGAITASLDGGAWSSTATWLWQGESLQVNAAPADGWSLTFVARTLADGSTVKSAAEADSFPIEVELTDAGGGWVLAYPTDGDSLTSDSGGGTLSISFVDEDALEACFAFEAASSEATLSAESGAINATPF